VNVVNGYAALVTDSIQVFWDAVSAYEDCKNSGFSSVNNQSHSYFITFGWIPIKMK